MLGIISQLGLHGTVLHVAQYYVGVLAATILFIATNAGMIGISRLSWSLAEHRQLPSLFSQLHPTLPHALVHDRVLLGARGGADPVRATPNVLGNLYSFGAMLSFTIAHAAVIALRIKDPDRERPYRMPWNVRIRGRTIPMTAVIGGIGTVGAWVRRGRAAPRGARSSASPGWSSAWSATSSTARRQGLDPRKHYRIARPERPPDFEELDYRTALVPIFGDDVSASRARRAPRS